MSAHQVHEDELAQAIDWMVRLRSGEAPEELWQACARWRSADPRHEAAWQALQASERLLEMPTPQARIARQTLEGAGRASVSRRQTLKLLGLVSAGWLVLDSSNFRSADYSTAIGQRSSIALTDHTRMWLNTDSAVDRSTSSQPPHIALQRGQIQIAHHAGELAPLLVRSGELRLITRDSRFDLQRQGEHHRLDMLEGSADVQFAHHPVARLTAGQRWLIGADGRRPLRDDHLAPGTWIDGQLVVKRMPLAQLVDELARYRSGWLQCADDIASLPVSGVFQLDDIERTLDALGASLPVKTQRLSRLWARIVPA
ncbi:DUF4880 domain-containing protein [Pseudomonas sp. BJa5]|uniref:DUF4880 domain-containing protein n=1 Tax=Pseudomonas sp. BJa5 TaxID=2936270 RepID=UPI002559C04A|nr:DUF4880 domain-containing protein [Pseudomonas sp. BGr12]MDL2422994.1 DUF4880 domain-containing protein [Pseudomonas sp. BGr12]